MRRPVPKTEEHSAARARAIFQLSLEATVVEVVVALERAGVRALVLKGAAFTRWLYDDPGDRSYRDIDLLVDPARADNAESALRELGFISVEEPLDPLERTPHHTLFNRAGARPAFVELHHTLALLSAPTQRVWKALSAHATTFQVGGAWLPAPCEAASALIVALHAAQHGTAFDSAIRDLNQALERVPTHSWRGAAKLAHELDATGAFAVGLQLEPRGAALAAALGLEVNASRHVRLMASGAPTSALTLDFLLATPGIRSRLRLVARKLVPSRAYMARAHPEGAGWRLPLAYAGRLVQIAIQLPRGLAAWRRSR